MNEANSFKGDPDDDFELDPENPIGGVLRGGRRASLLSTSFDDHSRIH